MASRDNTSECDDTYCSLAQPYILSGIFDFLSQRLNHRHSGNRETKPFTDVLFPICLNICHENYFEISYRTSLLMKSPQNYSCEMFRWYLNPWPPPLIPRWKKIWMMCLRRRQKGANKIIIKSKRTSCDLDHFPTTQQTQDVEPMLV